MNTQHTTPKFDCIDYSKEAPEGMAYAYGWDHHGTCYFGIVYVDEQEIIGIQETIFRGLHHSNQ